MKIYVITNGEYSWYHIVGVTLDKEKAEKWVKLYNAADKNNDAQIEEFEADDFGREGLYWWHVSKDCVETIVRPADLYKDDDVVWIYGDNEFELNVFASSKKTALKAAYDKVAKEKARRAGL